LFSLSDGILSSALPAEAPVKSEEGEGGEKNDKAVFVPAKPPPVLSLLLFFLPPLLCNVSVKKRSIFMHTRNETAR
jgi:hypothetical protein